MQCMNGNGGEGWYSLANGLQVAEENMAAHRMLIILELG